MTEADSPPVPAPRASPVSQPFRARFAVRVARWAAELATVFVGVYAAFLLNNHQIHRQEQQRRGQILDWLEKEYAENLADIKVERASIQKEAESFNRQVEAGEMPALGAFEFHTDYDPVDMASVLSGGGFDLLEVETVREIKESENTLRTMVSDIRHDQQLSDELVLPNLEKDRSVFYDPATRKLRPTYHWYAHFYRSCLASYAELQPQIEKLLAQIRAERQRNR